ncbi:hypothetical protein EIP91_006596 [Steccherinum ochraceum]|uniref:F-box domain-containing protein n=1 Tax=Steccherinum ochraceum TaxID=92696 RepID=A0A4R0R869_9APHY|nr:hypothetical protein EIP91_006596 [Steccherinum ochraceum]
MTTSYIPPELIDAILTYLQPSPCIDDTEGTPYEEYQVLKTDLQACSLVCRAWRGLTLLHLFHDVRVSYQLAGDPFTLPSKTLTGRFHPRSGRPRTLANFYLFLIHSPHIRVYIRKLRLVFAPPVKRGSVNWPSWSTEDYPTGRLLLGLLDSTLLPQLSHLELRDVYLQPLLQYSETIRGRRKVVRLKELRLWCQLIHVVNLPDISDLLSLFGDVVRLHLCGYPSIQPGHDRCRFDNSSLRTFRPESITVNDPTCYGPLLLKMSSSPSIMSIDGLVVSVGASQKVCWHSGMSQLVEAVGPQLKHFSCVHMLHLVNHHILGLSRCPNIETLTFYLNIYDEQWYWPNYRRWEAIHHFLSSLAGCHEQFSRLRKIVLSITSRDRLLTCNHIFNPQVRDLSLIVDVETLLVQLVQARSTQQRQRLARITGTTVPYVSPLVLSIVPQSSGGQHIASFGDAQQRSFRRAFPILSKMGAVEW